MRLRVEFEVDRARKEELVASLKDTFNSATIVVVTQQSGMTVKDSISLRRQMLASNARYRVIKNRLVLRALVGTPYEGMAHLFSGPTAIAWSTDPLAAARVIVDFAKTNDKITVVGGGFGAQLLDEDEIKALASLPSLDELRAQLIGLVMAPATKVAGLLQAPAGQVTRVVKAYADKKVA